MVRRVRLVGIYDADGGLAGEFRYALSKLRGRNTCALCDLTHGWNPLGSRSWKQACVASSVDLELVHRDEASTSQLAAAAELPAIVADDGEGWSQVMTKVDIEACAGSPENLFELLRTC